jgi:plasmid rolling circle replication initiator protein Rep
MWKAKAYKIIPKVVADYPKYRWIFMTLTVKNCRIGNLRETIDMTNKGFKRLKELKIWPGKGWVKSVEVTMGQDGISAHPHLHVLAMVMPSYFSHGYISQKRWAELWQKCLRVDYLPVIHVRAIAKDKDPKMLIPEILKYQVKESDLVADREWFLELTRQLHKTRAVAVGGILRKYTRELESAKEDVVDEVDGVVDEERLFFQWKGKLKKYKERDNRD